MNRKIIIFGGLALFVFLLLVLGSMYLENKNEEMYNDSVMSNYEYNINIESNRTLQNVTLYLLLWERGGSRMPRLLSLG